MTNRVQLARAKRFDAKVRSLVAKKNRRMAELAYTLLKMREEGLHLTLRSPTIAKYAVRRGVTRSMAQARELILVATRVQRWPLLKEAFEQGALDWTKLRDALRALERSEGDREDEKGWLQRILEGTSREIEREARAPARAAADLDLVDAADDHVTHTFTHSRERGGRLEQALQRARTRGRGTETDAEALASIIDEWLAASDQGGHEELACQADPEVAGSARAPEAAETTMPAAPSLEPADHAVEEPSAGHRRLRVLPAVEGGSAEAPCERPQVRLAGSALEVVVTSTAVLVSAPGVEAEVHMPGWRPGGSLVPGSDGLAASDRRADARAVERGGAAPGGGSGAREVSSTGSTRLPGRRSSEAVEAPGAAADVAVPADVTEGPQPAEAG